MKFHWYIVSVVLLMSICAVALTTSALHENQTVDEGVHLAAGFSYWKTGDFRMNPEHPPLMKLLSSVPLLFLGIHFPSDDPSWGNGDEWGFARQLIYHNTRTPETILFLGRLPIILLTLVLVFLVGRAARQRWGEWGSLLSMSLIALEPTVIAHGHYVTTDLGVTLFFFLTILAFESYLQTHTRKHLLLVALWFALAQLSKFSAGLLLPYLGLRLLVHLAFLPEAKRASFSIHRAARGLSIILGITFILILITYRGTTNTVSHDSTRTSPYLTQQIWQTDYINSQPLLPRITLLLTKPNTATGKAVRWMEEHIPIPAYPYFNGFTDVITHSSYGHDAYLIGEFRSTGWIQYFPIAFLLKTPLPTLLLYILTIIMLCRPFARRLPARARTDATLLACAAGFYLACSMMSALNIGVRHILPLYPLLATAAGSLTLIRLPLWRMTLPTLLITAVIATGWSSLHSTPHAISYFSDIIGGSKNGYRYLIDSNLDWGQELKHLGSVMQQRTIPFVHIVYFGQTPLETYVPDFRSLPGADNPAGIASLDGWVAASVSAIYARDSSFSWLRDRTPTLVVGNAINLYDLRKSSAVLH